MSIKNKIVSNTEPNIYLIIVTYNPDDSLLTNISNMSVFVKEIVVVDNASSNKQILNKVRSLDSYNVTIIENKENLGLATALNQGIKYALQNKSEYIITLDQDSYFEQGSINLLYDRIVNLPDVALLGPDVINLYTKKRKYPKFKFEDGLYYLQACVMQSGAIYRSSVFEDTGLFEEKLFIYYIDDDFCKRLAINYKIAICNDAILYHEEGENGEKIYGSRKIFYRKYSSNAMYYISRNCIYMIKKYGVGESKRLFTELRNILLFQDNKIELFKSYSSGIKDGITGKFGERHEM